MPSPSLNHHHHHHHEQQLFQPLFRVKSTNAAMLTSSWCQNPAQQPPLLPQLASLSSSSPSDPLHLDVTVGPSPLREQPQEQQDQGRAMFSATKQEWVLRKHEQHLHRQQQERQQKRVEANYQVPQEREEVEKRQRDIQADVEQQRQKFREDQLQLLDQRQGKQLVQQQQQHHHNQQQRQQQQKLQMLWSPQNSQKHILTPFQRLVLRQQQQLHQEPLLFLPSSCPSKFQQQRQQEEEQSSPFVALSAACEGHFLVERSKREEEMGEGEQGKDGSTSGIQEGWMTFPPILPAIAAATPDHDTALASSAVFGEARGVKRTRMEGRGQRGMIGEKGSGGRGGRSPERGTVPRENQFQLHSPSGSSSSLSRSSFTCMKGRGTCHKYPGEKHAWWAPRGPQASPAYPTPLLERRMVLGENNRLTLQDEQYRQQQQQQQQQTHPGSFLFKSSSTSTVSSFGSTMRGGGDELLNLLMGFDRINHSSSHCCTCRASPSCSSSPSSYASSSGMLFYRRENNRLTTIIRSLEGKLFTLTSQLENQRLQQEEQRKQQEIESLADGWWCHELLFSSLPYTLPSSPSSLLPRDDVALEESLDRFLVEMLNGFNGEGML